MNKALRKALKINIYEQNLPILNKGEICSLSDVWDGNGDPPEDSYSYRITDSGEDGNSVMDICINYCFEILNLAEDPLDTKVKITDIQLI